MIIQKIQVFKILSLFIFLVTMSCSSDDNLNNEKDTLLSIKFGDITDEEAQSIISNVKTENIKNLSINNSTKLTTLNFAGIKTIEKITITNNTSLERILLPDLDAVNTILIFKNNNLQTISFPKLKEINLKFSLFDNSKIEVMEAPNLEVCKLSFSINTNASLKTILLPALKSVATTRITNGEDDGGFYINRNNVLETINLPNLQSSWITHFNGSTLKTIQMNKLETMHSLKITSSINTLDMAAIKDFETISILETISPEDIDTLFNTLINIDPPIRNKNINLKGMASDQAQTQAETLRTNGNTVTINRS